MLDERAPASLAAKIQYPVSSIQYPVSVSSIHFPHHNIDASENNHYIGNGVTEAHIFENRKIDETRRTHTITIRVRSTVTDQIKTELAFGCFNAPISFADRRAKGANFHLRVDDGAGKNLLECLFQNSDALAHFQYAHH